MLLLLSLSARAQEDNDDPNYLRDNFFKLPNASGPPRCEGKWCAVVTEICCMSGRATYYILLRDPKGNVTRVNDGSIGMKPEFVLDDQGRIKVDEPLNPWSPGAAGSQQEEEATAATSKPSEKVLGAALAACKKASPTCARQFTSTKGGCNRRGCVLSVSNEGETPLCFMWQAAGSSKMDLLGLYVEAFGYSGPDYSLGTTRVSLVGDTCKNGCEVEITALLRDKLRRLAEPGEIPRSAATWADTTLIAPVDAFRLRHVTYGLFSWDNALDAAARWQLALLPSHVQLKVSVVDDVLELEPCAAGKQPAVKCDHLELVVEDGPARGAMVSILLSPGGAARVERWREPGGQDVPPQPIEAKRCGWSRVEKKQSQAVHELTVRCDVPRDALWGEGSSRSLSLRYSDAEQGQQQSLVSVTQAFRALSEYPPAFVPKVERCAVDASQ